MIYRCIKDFEISNTDEEGEETGDYGFVCCDSLWKLTERHPMFGADLVLDSLDYDEGKSDYPWIEVSKELLKNNFKIEKE